jgi:macrolide-specific efflux system membrane fusion protein
MITPHLLRTTTAACVVALAVAIASGPPASAQIVVEAAVVKLIDEAELAAGEPGLVTSIVVREGQTIERGAVLARIDDRAAQLAERAARIELDLARAEAANDVAIRFAETAYEVARAELARSQESIAKFPKSISQSQLDVERLTTQKLELEIEQARHEQQLAKLRVAARENELAAAQLAAQRRRIESPIAGTVVEVRAREGEWVEVGQSVVRVVNVDRVKVEAMVTAAAAADLTIGCRVLIEQPDTERMTGTLAFVSPEIDPINNQVRIWAEVDNKQRRLRPGDTVSLVIGGEHE